MNKVRLYCLSFKHYDLVDKLPYYIKPLGLGNQKYPSHWLIDSVGQNISSLNKYYGQYTGIYWIWKNELKDMDDNDWIGTCEYRKYWLNELFKKKQKFTARNLYSNLLKVDNEIFSKCEAVLVQPIFFKTESVNEQFYKIHKFNILKNSHEFLDQKDRETFKNFLNKNKLSAPPLFITKVKIFKKFCEQIFPILEKCYNYFNKNKMCNEANIRLPAFFIERYSSFWFEENCKTEYLSHARIGKVMLSNKLNKFINPIKFPFTMRMYPTIHDY